MTDDRAEKLAEDTCHRAFGSEPFKDWQVEIARAASEAALAAVDADPETYGYRKIKPPQTLNLSARDKANILRYHGDESTTAGAP